MFMLILFVFENLSEIVVGELTDLMQQLEISEARQKLCGWQKWAAAGVVDTLLRCEDETGDGYGKETAIQA